jgi:hypothetical protein
MHSPAASVDSSKAWCTMIVATCKDIVPLQLQCMWRLFFTGHSLACALLWPGQACSTLQELFRCCVESMLTHQSHADSTVTCCCAACAVADVSQFQLSGSNGAPIIISNSELFNSDGCAGAGDCLAQRSNASIVLCGSEQRPMHVEFFCAAQQAIKCHWCAVQQCL